LLTGLLKSSQHNFVFQDLIELSTPIYIEIDLFVMLRVLSFSFYSHTHHLPELLAFESNDFSTPPRGNDCPPRNQRSGLVYQTKFKVD
jgi:hypothetical protein